MLESQKQKVMSTPATFVTRIRDKDLKPKVKLYRPLPLLLRLDILPFILWDLTAIYLVYQFTLSWSIEVYLPFLLPLAAIQALTLLSSQWSVGVMCFTNYYAAASLNAATHILVQPTCSTDTPQLCQLINRPTNTKQAKIWFEYQKMVFCLKETESESIFVRLCYPTGEFVDLYRTCRGFPSSKSTEISDARMRWDANRFDIPIPPFMELFKEHAVAPFFIFQVFSVLLWCLDEYVYYALMTLAMLVVFECTVVKQRQRNMRVLRNMLRPAQECYVYRGKWMRISSDELLPGDICSVRPSDHLSQGHDDNAQLVPCDVLLLGGSCVVNEAMLSGESIPLRKDSLGTPNKKTDTLQIEDGTSMIHKKHVVFAGTKILQHIPSDCKSLGFPKCPDEGCPAYVLRTGFGTTQGSLMRTILFSSQRVSANNAEALYFICLLLVFAVMASGYVLHYGLQDATRSRFKLLLHCIMIVTSVVPPELPMQLSLAVNNSLIALSKAGLFCTEPFRIPFAGKISVCCFDKTGTLTSDELLVEGVTPGINSYQKGLSNPFQVLSADELDVNTTIILAGCHSLVSLNSQVAGDPLEKAVFSKIKWSLKGENSVISPPNADGSHHRIQIFHRYPFSSELKRMSTLVSTNNVDSDGTYRIISKGAPETMKPLFKKVPDDFDDVQKHYAALGCRVLVLGYKDIKGSVKEIRELPRSAVESGLAYCGFLVLNCPLKSDSKKTIRDLLKSQHRVIMITGDNPLTACEVARQVGINTKKSVETLLLEEKKANQQNAALEWTTVESPSGVAKSIAFDKSEVRVLAKSYNLCVTGSALKSAVTNLPNTSEDDHVASYLNLLDAICPYVTVYARTSPKLKEYIVRALNRAGEVTLMCGDGTNDVGALKQAHVGISIINNPELEETMQDYDMASKKSSISTSQSGSRSRKLQQLSKLADQQRASVKLGDASIASPFTSKSPSIRVTKDIIRHGRCTLVTTVQMFKILGVNCLITAYMLSFLYLNGVKQGDQQMTVSGLAVAFFFLFMSLSKPTKKLAVERPISRVFCVPVMVSIFGQFAIHMVSLIKATELGMPFIDRKDPSLHPDGPFSPSVINTIIFLIGATMQLNTFVVNYVGRPFMQGFQENKALFRSSMLAYVLLVMAVFEVFPPLNELLELVPMPNDEVRMSLFLLMVQDTISVVVLKRLVS